MFKKFYKSIFAEKINDISLERHKNDPEWLDIHYDELKSFNEENFSNLIKFTLLRDPNILMLNILLKHNFDFTKTNFCNIMVITRKTSITLDIFKWIIDNKIIKKDDKGYFDLCKYLLMGADQISFDKFKYAFEEGFPFSNYGYIAVSNINVAEQIYQYTNNSRDINLRYTIDSSLNLNDKSLDFLKDYIEWLKLHAIEDIFISSLWRIVAKSFGISGLEILKDNGYLIPTIYADLKGISNDVKDYLIFNGFENRNIENNVIYHVKPIIDSISDTNSVAKEMII
jgi:hypothetical protein